MKKFILIFVLILFTNFKLMAMENKIIIKLEHGDVEIELFIDQCSKTCRKNFNFRKIKNMTALFFIELLMVLWLKQVMSNLEILIKKVLI